MTDDFGKIFNDMFQNAQHTAGNNTEKELKKEIARLKAELKLAKENLNVATERYCRLLRIIDKIKEVMQ